MTSKIKKISIYFFTHLTAAVLGGAAVYFAWEPASIVWGLFLGSEIHSRSSYPRNHIARIDSAWGFGEQQLIFIVDGRRVYRTPDFAPGNINEEIVWDESGEIVTFMALNQKIFTYDTRSGMGLVEK